MESIDSSVQIIPYYAHPHVYTVIRDNTWYDETVASRSNDTEKAFTTAVVTGADSGIDNTFIRLTDFATKKAIFGLGNFNKYGQSSLQADALFNGNTAVWFCRVLPENATYANAVILAHFRVGNDVDEDFQPTGLQRMEIKFELKYANKPYIEDGATTVEVIEEFANTFVKTTPDAQTQYRTLPIAYIRSTGRGQYGNGYSFSITRDQNAEKDYQLKMYDFNIINNTATTNKTQVINILCGALHETIRSGVSMLISDVIDQYGTGSSPVQIITFEDNFEALYNFYENSVVAVNKTYIENLTTVSEEMLADLQFAEGIRLASFDPIFGLKYNTRINETIPYYKNYTVLPTGDYIEPDLPVTAKNLLPTTTAAEGGWTAARVGATVLVKADSTHDGLPCRYTVISIDEEEGTIEYDSGVVEDPDAAEYDGVNLAINSGNTLVGGHDGDFQEINVDGTLRRPTASEMKLLLSREYVKAFRGDLDRKILSPARMDLDFLFDANYNMTSEDDVYIDENVTSLYSNSTVLTSADAQELTVMGTGESLVEYADLNVKGAMYDLVTFRNKRGMMISPEDGAGCSLYLDCNLTGLKSLDVNYELEQTLDMFEPFKNRSTSIDLGYFQIFDPRTAKRIKVTVSYLLAVGLVPHMMQYGINKPFVYDFATIRAIQKNSALTSSGMMIRDTFKPDIDLIDWDIKERLYKARINYYISENEGRIVKRACQNTRQLDASALLEESNMRVLNTLVKNIERDCQSFLYNWNEPSVRDGFTKAEMEKYRGWIGTLVQDLNIYFTANEWEQERMIMHCYVDVAFRDIIKRIIVEVNVNRPSYGDSTTLQYS